MVRQSIFILLFLIALFIEVAQTQAIQYKMILFPTECFDQFFVYYNFTHFDCLAKTASKGLSIAIVVLSLSLKLPQILKIKKSQSVKGLSFDALFNESLMYMFNVAYNLHKGNEFMLYGENMFIILQNFIIFYLFWIHDKEVTTQKILKHLVFYVTLSVPLIMGMLPDVVFTFSIYINMILIFVARVPQIQMNYRNKSTGQLALITQLLSLAGSITRAFTIFVSTNDLLYNMQNVEAVIFNTTLVTQLFLYGRKQKQ